MRYLIGLFCLIVVRCERMTDDTDDRAVCFAGVRFVRGHNEAYLMSCSVDFLLHRAFIRNSDIDDILSDEFR